MSMRNNQRVMKNHEKIIAVPDLAASLTWQIFGDIFRRISMDDCGDCGGCVHRKNPRENHRKMVVYHGILMGFTIW